jgi:hypothetical protein
MDINTVISNLNVFQLGPLLQLVKRLQTLSQESGQMGSDGIRHQFFISTKPYYLAAENWPDDLRRQAIKYLQKCLALELDSVQQDTVENLLNNILFSKFDDVIWQRGQKYNKILDSIRGQDHQQLFQPKDLA